LRYERHDEEVAPLNERSEVACGHSIEWGASVRPCPGEVDSGDQYVVVDTRGGLELAVIDGLGHGPEAAYAARAAAAIIRCGQAGSLADRVRDCDAALRDTRGAVLTVARIDPGGTLTWLGVGNVAGLVWRRTRVGLSIAAVTPSGSGIVGFNLPPLFEQRFQLVRGDLLVLGTDGIDAIEQRSPGWLNTPTQMAEALVTEHARVDDDALVLDARYDGA
jgi:hypothetical protein